MIKKFEEFINESYTKSWLQQLYKTSQDGERIIQRMLINKGKVNNGLYLFLTDGELQPGIYDRFDFIFNASDFEDGDLKLKLNRIKNSLCCITDFNRLDEYVFEQIAQESLTNTIVGFVNINDDYDCDWFDDNLISTLSERISVSSVENTEIIKIQVSDENNKRAKEIATTTADVFMKEVKNIYNLTNVSVIDKASLEENPYNINIVKQLLIVGAIGFVLSSGIIFLIFYFDTTIKSSKDIEEKLGLPVIGNITLIDKKGE